MIIRDEIVKLKKEKDVLFLSHYYEDAEIQDLADFVGDSLALAQKGRDSDKPNILLAGVVFMGESVKILSPEKTVLVPDMAAGCSLVDHSPFEKYLNWRNNHPDGICVTYVNSSAKVKAISDVICTSSNAEKIINSIPKHRPILFGPDRNLGSFLMKKTGRHMVLWPGACEVHILFSAKKIFDLKLQHPGAVVLAHPECDEAVLQYSDVVGSTSKLLEESKTSKANSFIVATEPGIIHQMKKGRPDAEFFLAPMEGSCHCDHCPYMKLNTLEKIKATLTHFTPQIHVDTSVAVAARIPLQRMMDITEGRAVTWPERFAPERHLYSESASTV